MNVKSEMLVESKSLRETVIDRVDVLEKVRKLSMLPGDIYCSIEMVASYYEVPVKTIQGVVIKNKMELKEDGLKVLRGDELISLKEVSLVPKKTPAFTALPKRAVLRIGMLLQDSEVAKAVRSYLLDAEEEKTAAPPQTDYSTLSPQLQFMIMMEQKTNALEAQQKVLKQDVEAMKGTFEAIKDIISSRDEDWRKIIKDMINAIVYRLKGDHAEIRNKSYEMLEARAHCNLNTRLKNWHDRLIDKGHTKSSVEKINRMDVIENDAKLKEIYTTIIKELSINSLTVIGG